MQNGEVCSADASVFCAARDARTWKSGNIYNFTWLAAVMMVRIFWGTCVSHMCRVVLVPRESDSRVFRHTMHNLSQAVVDIHIDLR